MEELTKLLTILCLCGLLAAATPVHHDAHLRDNIEPVLTLPKGLPADPLGNPDLKCDGPLTAPAWQILAVFLLLTPWLGKSLTQQLPVVLLATLAISALNPARAELTELGISIAIEGNSDLQDIALTTDGYYVSYVVIPAEGYKKTFITKRNWAGEETWLKVCASNNGNLLIFSIVANDDGSITGGGRVHIGCFANSCLYSALFFIDAAGESLQIKYLLKNHRITYLTKGITSTYLGAVTTNSGQVCIMKLNSDGTAVESEGWTDGYKCAPDITSGIMNAVLEISENKIIGIGQQTVDSRNQGFMYIIDGDSDAGTVYSYEQYYISVCSGILKLSENEILIVGHRKVEDGKYNGWAFKVNLADDPTAMVWEKTYYETRNNYFVRAVMLEDGTVALGGRKAQETSVQKFWVLTIDPEEGNEINEIFDEEPAETHYITNIVALGDDRAVAAVGYTKVDNIETPYIKVAKPRCNAGTYYVPNEKFCRKCTPGTYQEEKGHLACVLCPAGQYQDIEGQAACKSCPAGEYQNEKGKKSCKKCLAGTFSVIGSDTCTDCEPGTYQDTPGQGSCIDCPVGQYQDLKGQITCKPCETGKYQPAKKQTSCIPCDAGKYQDQTGQNSCIVCNTGYAQPESGQSECVKCAPGTYQPNKGKETCIECDLGRYQDEEGKISCKTCAAGYYQDTTGQIGCKACIEGYYQSAGGQDTCIACEAGKHQPNQGQESCIDCPAGTFQASTGKGYCDNCKPGTYQELKGQQSCNQCAAGTYQSEYGQTLCNTCPIGQVQDKPGQDKCLKCFPGYYQPLQGQLTCLECQPGTFQSQYRQTGCEECPIGHYQAASGKGTCEACRPGTYQPEIGKTTYFECSPGSYQDEWGKDKCKVCPAGTYQLFGGQSSCTRCPAGFYQFKQGQTECLKCPGKTYSKETGSSSCLACDAPNYPSISKDRCLYKGVFESEEAFAEHPVKSACFDGSTIVKPFTTECRETYKQLCCDGSYLSEEVSCNYLLEVVGTSLQNKYCGPCPFIDSTACPEDEVCWSNKPPIERLLKESEYEYTTQCLEAISPYCGPRLTANREDVECATFAGECFAEVVSSTYAPDYSYFVIEFSKRIPSTPLKCNELFDKVKVPAFPEGNVECEVLDEYLMKVTVSGLESAVTRYRFAKDAMKDLCGVSLSHYDLHEILPPEIGIETLSIGGGSDDKCKGITVESLVEVFYYSKLKL